MGEGVAHSFRSPPHLASPPSRGEEHEYGNVKRTAYLQLAAAVVLFGLSFPILKIGLRASTPVWLAAGRASLSALTAFVLLAALRRLRWPQRADWPIVLSVGAFQLTL